MRSPIDRTPGDRGSSSAGESRPDGLRRIDRLATDANRRRTTLAAFSERTRRWFERSFEAPTPAQATGWPAIASGAQHADLRADRLRQDAEPPSSGGSTRSRRRPEELGDRA